MSWYEKYMGKPWAAVPDPPHSYTCGELVRDVLRRERGFDVPEIIVDAESLYDTVKEFADASPYGLIPVPVGEKIEEFDVVYMARVHRVCHVGVFVMVAGERYILHTMEECGTLLETVSDLKARGFIHLYVYRFAGVKNA